MKVDFFKKIKMPDKPGVYFFKQGTKILYIGKATSLRDRTKSYFAKDLINTRGPFILDMVFKAAQINWHETDSVLEALILEANLIKKHQPYYNTKEKDNKSFLSVVITAEALPRVFAIRSRTLREHSDILENVRMSKIYGPFTSGPQLREALQIVRRIFPFLDDKSENYLEFYRQINLVPDLADRKLYLQNIRNIKLFFSGKKKKIIANLKRQMKEYAKVHAFEEAGEVKRQLFSLKHINDVALIKYPYPASPYIGGGALSFSKGGGGRIESYDIAHMSGKNIVGVMTVVLEGEADRNEYRKFKIRTQTNTNDTGALKEVLERRLAHREWPFPQLIVVDGGMAQLNAARSIMSRTGLDIPVVSVLKDERHKPKDILGDKKIISGNKRTILLSNSEAHRFAITYHKNLRAKSFLK